MRPDNEGFRPLVIGGRRRDVVSASVLVWVGCAVVVSFGGLWWLARPGQPTTSAPPAVVAPEVPAVSPVVTGEVGRQGRVEAPVVAVAGSVAVSELGEKDAEVVVEINRALVAGGFAPIGPDARVGAADLELAKRVAREMTMEVERTAQDWLSLAEQSVEGEKRRVMASVDRGQLAGLPLESPTNRLKRRHPHEAISGLQYGGQNYILRADSTDLANTGQQFEITVQQRLMAFETILKPLFREGR